MCIIACLYLKMSFAPTTVKQQFDALLECIFNVISILLAIKWDFYGLGHNLSQKCFYALFSSEGHLLYFLGLKPHILSV